jgi:hypothetical protein
MANPIRIWTCSVRHPVFRCGGWASVRVSQGLISGVVGGERNTTAARMALAGLAAGLSGLAPIGDSSPAAPIIIHTPSPELAALADFLAGGMEPAKRAGSGVSTDPKAGPDEDLDLWAQILAASKGRRLDVVRVSPQPDTPTAFAAAWADLAMDKAKARGPFTAAIPKPNLAKAPGLSETAD